MAVNKTKTRNFNKEIKDLDSQAQEQIKAIDNSVYIKSPEDDTRHKIAKSYVRIYFILLGIIIIGVPIYNLVAYKATNSETILQIKLSDLIQTYSAIVGPTLGFVIAYYFKSKNEK